MRFLAVGTSYTVNVCCFTDKAIYPLPYAMSFEHCGRIQHNGLFCDILAGKDGHLEQVSKLNDTTHMFRSYFLVMDENRDGSRRRRRHRRSIVAGHGDLGSWWDSTDA
jgi:hypothetical protein